MHGKTEPSLQDRDGCLARDACTSVVTVMLGVVTACLDVMMFGVHGMAMRSMGMVGGLLMIACLMMLGGLAMVLGPRCRGARRPSDDVRHPCVRSCLSPGLAANSPQNLRKSADTLLTDARQVCGGSGLQTASRNRHQPRCRSAKARE
jgi:hypothetical protein